jgi:transposase-like protein
MSKQDKDKTKRKTAAGHRLDPHHNQRWDTLWAMPTVRRTSSRIAGTSMKRTLRVGGTWRYLFRAIDQFGQVVDVFLSPRRDAQAARGFFERAIDRTWISPVEVTTDRYRVYPRVLDELVPAAFHGTKVHANNPI